jgi:hypothetical protein
MGFCVLFVLTTRVDLTRLRSERDDMIIFSVMSLSVSRVLAFVIRQKKSKSRREFGFVARRWEQVSDLSNPSAVIATEADQSIRISLSANFTANYDRRREFLITSMRRMANAIATLRPLCRNFRSSQPLTSRAKEI